MEKGFITSGPVRVIVLCKKFPDISDMSIQVDTMFNLREECFWHHVFMFGKKQKILHEWSFHMKRAFGEFYISYEMTTSIRVYLSYDTLKWDFIAFKNNIHSTRKRIADTNVVKDVAGTPENVIHVWSYDFTTRRCPLNNSDVI